MRVTVGVLRGGPSSEYEVSLRSGACVLEELDRDLYKPEDIFISKKGQWHRNGIEMTPERALRGVDVAFNVLHGEYGESGEVQRLLDTLQVPYTGPASLEAAHAFNKHRTKETLKPLGVKVAHHAVVERMSPEEIERKAFELFRSFPMPAIVKPAIGGSSVGMTIARDYPSLVAGLNRAFEITPKALVEEFIRGREATVGVIDAFRGAKTYSLLPVEIIPPKESPFFDYDAKYSGKTIELSPGNFSAREKEALMQAAKIAHEGIGLSHYSRSDFIVSKRGVYFLEINSAPAVGLTKESLFPKALHSVGASIKGFLSHIILLAYHPSVSAVLKV